MDRDREIEIERDREKERRKIKGAASSSAVIPQAVCAKCRAWLHAYETGMSVDEIPPVDDFPLAGKEDTRAYLRYSATGNTFR